MVSDGKKISEPDEVRIYVKKRQERQYYNQIYQYSPYLSAYNILLSQYLINGRDNNFLFYSMPLFVNSFLPYYPLSYLSSSRNFGNYYKSSDTLSMIVNSPYATNFIFGSGYLDSTINIIVNNYYTYNYYY